MINPQIERSSRLPPLQPQAPSCCSSWKHINACILPRLWSVAPRAACAPNLIEVEGRDVGKEQCEGTKLLGHIPSIADAEPPAAITQKSWDQGKNPSSPRSSNGVLVGVEEVSLRERRAGQVACLDLEAGNYLHANDKSATMQTLQMSPRSSKCGKP